MTHPIGPSRGDRRRNARKARLRSLVPREYAIVGVDLADHKQVFAVCDHDGQVLGRRSVKARAWALVDTLRWAQGTAAAAKHLAVVIAHGEHLLVISQVDPDDGVLPGHQRPQPRLPRVAPSISTRRSD